MKTLKTGADIQEMFGSIAEKYDFMNKIITLGNDQKWRKFVIDKACTDSGKNVILDAGAGTGDIGIEALKRNPYNFVVCSDFSVAMMLAGRKKTGAEKIVWHACDCLKLAFKDNCFDAVTSGYLSRNVVNIERTFKEQHRVLKPGGTVVCLDTCPPEKNIFLPFVLFYMNFILPLLGRIFAGSNQAYSYLSQSTVQFKKPEEMKKIIESAGFCDVDYKKFMFGTVVVYWGKRKL